MTGTTQSLIDKLTAEIVCKKQIHSAGRPPGDSSQVVTIGASPAAFTASI